MHHAFGATSLSCRKPRVLPRPGEKTTHCLGAFATKAAFITAVNDEHHSNDKAENATAC
jgi:hypothetical protein